MAKEDPSDEFAQAFVAVDNIVVVSGSFDKVEGKNTRIVRTNLHDEILKLKQEEGKDIHTRWCNPCFKTGRAWSDR